MSKIINKYLKEISEIPSNATEMSFRTPLENLLNGFAASKEIKQKSGKVTVFHEPSREKEIGAPDFLLLNEGEATIGYVECKKTDEDLSKLIGGEQLKKYSNLSDNALITNYRQFILLQKDYPPREVDLSASAVTSDDKKLFQTIITDFMSTEIGLIDDPKKLAKILAERCEALRDGLERELSDTPKDNRTKNAIIGLLNIFKTTLYQGITHEQFADAMAQTATYTLLIAKLKSPLGKGKKLDISGLKQHIPENFALIRDISGFLENLKDTPLKYLLDNILAVINAIDREGLIERSRKTEGDMYLYFYENFLAAYSAKLRQSRGVYYTPPPMVKFIVRATDDILRRDFGKREGLAAPKVTALDFAAGTGTFMLEIFRLALENKEAAKRDIIIRQRLLKNIFGFELLIAPYVIAHLKLSAFLSDMGVDLMEDERINVFLTNTLEENLPEHQKDLLIILPALTEEVASAQKIKEKNILVITGNPPYSTNAMTAGSEVYERDSKRGPKRKVNDVRDTWIGRLLRDYYKVDGKGLGEKNPRALQDDYVKFIRFAQHKISEVDQGIVAIITNHGFLNNLTFRGMRQSLLNTFDQLYFLDMHGNSRIGETTPEGDKDENIFDIQQGVAVSILVKNKDLKEGVFHADIWGTRKEKENACLEYTIDSLKWKELKPVSPYYFFIPQDTETKAEYEKFYSLKDMFSTYGSGITTSRDSLTIHFGMEEIKAVTEKIATMQEKEASAFFDSGKNSEWRASLAQEDLRKNGLKDENYCLVSYRPFDIRHTHYTGKSGGFHCRPRDEIMRHMIAGKNIGLVSVRQTQAGTWQHVFVTDGIMECCYVSNKSKERNYLFPLYRYETEMDEIVRHKNFTPKFRDWINDRYGKEHTPEDILGCIYAVLHAPDYRQRYAEFLRFDYPRIPFPEDNESFSRLAKIGTELMNVHLLRKDCDNEIELGGDGKSHVVKEVCYNENKQRLYFNEDEYLAQVTPEVFNFKIGGYKPLEKFLKSRKGRNIIADIDALEKAANAVAFTVNAVKKITVL